MNIDYSIFIGIGLLIIIRIILFFVKTNKIDKYIIILIYFIMTIPNFLYYVSNINIFDIDIIYVLDIFLTNWTVFFAIFVYIGIVLISKIVKKKYINNKKKEKLVSTLEMEDIIKTTNLGIEIGVHDTIKKMTENKKMVKE